MAQPTVFQALDTTLQNQGASSIPAAYGGGGGGPNTNLIYPLVGHPKDWPIKMQFLCRRYEMLARLRAANMTPDPTDGDNLAVITLPLPIELTNNTFANYQEQIYETRFGILDATPAEIAEDFATGSGGAGKLYNLLGGFNLETFLGAFGRDVYYNYVRDKFGISDFHGEVPMDLRDAIYSSMQFRTHVFSWLFVPKNTAEAERVARICNMFNTLSHPMRNTTVQLASRAIHPPMWNISVYDEDGTQGQRHRWLPYPQLSVLQQVQIRTRQAETGPWTMTAPDGNGHWPVATQLGLTFIELEPNIAVVADGDGNGKIISRSGYLANAGLGSGGGTIYNDTQGEL